MRAAGKSPGQSGTPRQAPRQETKPSTSADVGPQSMAQPSHTRPILSQGSHGSQSGCSWTIHRQMGTHKLSISVLPNTRFLPFRSPAGRKGRAELSLETFFVFGREAASVTPHCWIVKHLVKVKILIQAQGPPGTH